MGNEECGVYVVCGKLFFRLEDGSSINCECIGEPYASQIVAMWNKNAEDTAAYYEAKPAAEDHRWD